jgi:hypothetical protein
MRVGPVPFDRFEFVGELACRPAGCAVHPDVDVRGREGRDPLALFRGGVVPVGLQLQNEEHAVSGDDEIWEAGPVADGIVVVEDHVAEHHAEFDDRP